MDLGIVKPLPGPRYDLADTGIARWVWFNVGGIQGSLEEVLEFIRVKRLVFLVLGETWLRRWTRSDIQL